MGCSNGKLGGGGPGMKILQTWQQKAGCGPGRNYHQNDNSQQLVPVIVNNNKKTHDTYVW